MNTLGVKRLPRPNALGQQNAVKVSPHLSTPKNKTRCNRLKKCQAVIAADPPSQAPSTPGRKPTPLGLGIYDKVASGSANKTRVVVLGSGWGAMSFIKALDDAALQKYEIILISPRNYFVYTPLLPAMCVGTVEERSIVEPVRSVMTNKGKFFEAQCKEIFPEEKSLVCCFPEDAGFPEACWKLPYDILVLGVGSVNNTFGIKGVADHCNFFKSVEDASRLRLRVSECFERAALPQTTPEERKKLLSFVMVGGGPTGVEVAAELRDLIQDDLSKIFPQEILDDVSIKLIELTDHVLSTYDRAISIYTAKTFAKNGIDLILNTRVSAVGSDAVTIVDKDGKESEIPFGACVWATGVAMHPLVKQLQERLPEGAQTHFRSVVTDEFLSVKGSNGSIFAFGDAATIEQQRALDAAEDLFGQADANKDGKLQLGELRDVMKKASKRFPHLAEHATFLENKYGYSRFGNVVSKAFASGGDNDKTGKSSIYKEIDETSALDKEQFQELLKTIDSGLRALPATAQVAKQEGEFLAKVLTSASTEPSEGRVEIAPGERPFEYFHKGSLAYVGSDRAVMDVPIVGPVMGILAGLAWRGFETFSQISFRNQVLVANDWVRTKLFGRDISRV
jgi:NADH:ubiquinone reductase (non-electrogenic)